MYVQILREDPTYPEALIGRGTAYAFQRELDAAIADFSKVFLIIYLREWERNPNVLISSGDTIKPISR